MGCKICGRNSCCESFHSLEAQELYDRFDGLDKDDLINMVIELEEELESCKNEN